MEELIIIQDGLPHTGLVVVVVAIVVGRGSTMAMADGGNCSSHDKELV